MTRIILRLYEKNPDKDYLGFMKKDIDLNNLRKEDYELLMRCIGNQFMVREIKDVTFTRIKEKSKLEVGEIIFEEMWK